MKSVLIASKSTTQDCLIATFHSMLCILRRDVGPYWLQFYCGSGEQRTLMERILQLNLDPKKMERTRSILGTISNTKNDRLMMGLWRCLLGYVYANRGSMLPLSKKSFVSQSQLTLMFDYADLASLWSKSWCFDLPSTEIAIRPRWWKHKIQPTLSTNWSNS